MWLLSQNIMEYHIREMDTMTSSLKFFFVEKPYKNCYYHMKSLQKICYQLQGLNSMYMTTEEWTCD